MKTISYCLVLPLALNGLITLSAQAGQYQKIEYTQTMTITTPPRMVTHRPCRHSRLSPMATCSLAQSHAASLQPVYLSLAVAAMRWRSAHPTMRFWIGVTTELPPFTAYSYIKLERGTHRFHRCLLLLSIYSSLACFAVRFCPCPKINDAVSHDRFQTTLSRAGR